MYEPEDFYDNYNEFDAQIMEFRQGLVKGIKQEFLDKLNQLTEENGRLQKIGDRMREIEKEHQAKLRELDKEKQSLIRTVRQERISQLFADRKITMYSANRKYTDKPKCGECNDKRKIVFISPQGESIERSCRCAITDKSYAVVENYAYELSISNRTNDLVAHYVAKPSYHDSGEYMNLDTTFCEKVYSGEPFESLKNAGLFFKQESECQKYCDYLNAKQAEQ